MLIELIGTSIGSGGLVVIIQSVLKHRDKISKRKLDSEFTEKENVQLITNLYEKQIGKMNSLMARLQDDMDILKNEVFELRIENKGLKSQNVLLLDKIKLLEQQLKH